MKNYSTSIVAAILAGGLTLVASGCATTEGPGSSDTVPSTAPATQTAASTDSHQITPVATSVSCATLIGDDGGLLTRSGEFLMGVTEFTADNGEEAASFSEAFEDVSRTASKELQEPISILREELDGLAAAIENNTDYQLILDDYASAGKEIIEVCSDGIPSDTVPATPTPTRSENPSVAQGSTELEVVTSEYGHEGYTMDFDWAFQDPGETEVVAVDAAALGSSDLSIAFNSSMRFVNTTEGNRTFRFQDDGGVNLVLRYPSGSPVCDYTRNLAVDGTSCLVEPWAESIVGIRFGDFPTLNEIMQEEATDPVNTTHELTLRDVPQAEVARVSEALADYEGVVLYLHYGETTDTFKTDCDQAALEGLDFASLYLVLGAVGPNHCPA